jgi:hypothetical protein
MQNQTSQDQSIFCLLDWILRYTLFYGFDTLGSHLREEGSLDYDGGLVHLQVQTNFDMTINRQQAPFSGAIADEQVIKIQFSNAFMNIFSFSLDLSFASLNFDHPQNKKNQSRVSLINHSFPLAFVYILFIANPNQRWTATSPTKNIYFVDGLEKFCRQR